MDVQFGVQDYNRSEYDLTRLRCQNWFAEQATSETDRPVALLSCPGITNYVLLGGSVCQGIDRQDGVLQGDIFAVASDTLYRVNSGGTASSIGSVGSSTAAARFAFIRPTTSATQGFIATLADTAGTVYLYDNASLTSITDPDVGSSVKDIASINQRLLFATGDDTFVWSEPLDPDNVDGLSFATAERSPDDLKAILVSQQEVWLMGSDTIEVWVDSGGFDVFVPVSGGFIERGLLARDLAVTEDNTVFWVGDDGVVYRAEGYRPVRVSTHSEEAVLQSLSAPDIAASRMWSYTMDGHKFVGIRTPSSGTLVYDVATGVWHTRESRGQNAYRPIGFVTRSNTVYCADGYAGNIRQLDKTTYQDMGQEIVRIATAQTPVRSYVPSFCFALDCAKGVGISSGQGSDPEIMLRYSDDGGNTWSNEYWRSVGQIGEYGARVIWRMMGRMRPPRRIWEVSFSDNTAMMLLGARVNDTEA